MTDKKEQKRKELVEKTSLEEKEILNDTGYTKEEYDKALYNRMLEEETEIDKDNFLMEVLLLIKEYMNGEFTFGDSGIECRFINGYKFRICASEADS